MFLTLLLCHRGHKCMHEVLQQKANVKFYSTSTRKAHTSYEWKNLRMQFDYSELTSDEGVTCKRVGQNVTNIFEDFQNITCEEEDIATDNKIEVVKKTLDNVKRFVEKLLYVIPLENGFKGQSTGLVVNDADYLMSVGIVSGGAESGTLAAASFEDVENKFNRPVIGKCAINSRQIPEKEVDYDSEENQFFLTLLHEIFHALGFAPAYFPMMHPQEESKPFDKINCSLTKYGKKFTFLVTPMCHRYAVNHYGVEEFEGDNGEKCPSGIELESGGAQGTVGAHLKGRVFMSEMMGGVTISKTLSFERLTDATLAVLADTGNYKINWSMAQPLVWGHPESINGSYLKDFALGPPQLVYPENYLFDETKFDYSFFNFKTLGSTAEEVLIRLDQVNCDDEEAPDFCKYLDNFYNPKHKSYIGNSDVYDYMVYKNPSYNCPKGFAAIHGSYPQCVNYACDEYKSVKFNIPQHGEITCDKNSIGKEYEIDVSQQIPAKVWCPDPEAFCRTTKLHDMHFVKNPFIKNVRQLDNSPQDDSDVRYIDSSYSQNDPNNKPSNDPKNSKKVIYIIVGVVCAVVVCACIVAGIFVYQKFIQKDDDDYKGFEEGKRPEEL